MPIYTYRCPLCAAEWTETHHVTQDRSTLACSFCGTAGERVKSLSPPSLRFLGDQDHWQTPRAERGEES